jgi:hypothetical protein
MSLIFSMSLSLLATVTAAITVDEGFGSVSSWMYFRGGCRPCEYFLAMTSPCAPVPVRRFEVQGVVDFLSQGQGHELNLTVGVAHELEFHGHHCRRLPLAVWMRL